MKLTLKLIALAVITLTGFAVIDNIYPVAANHLAIESVNGGDIEYLAQKSFRHTIDMMNYVWFICMALLSFLTVKKELKNMKLLQNTTVILSAMTLFLSSCKPYQKPVYKEIGNNETAFVIPLEGDTGNQAKFNSKENLEKHKVATKRIEIPTRWNKTGRYSTSGEWIPTVTVIVVDRSPITRNWEAQSNGKGKDTAIWVESSDSVGFSMGFNCTAFIKEEDTATFLYWYSSGSLSTVMDSEIRGRVQQVAAEESAKYPLDELRNKKNEIAASVRADIIPFFKERGITITTVGMFGGMTYENTSIQDSIDKVFIAQQEKNVSLAKLDAQKKENERIILQAEGAAKQRQIEAEAEAKAIESLTRAVAQGGDNYLQLKSLEVQGKQIEKWDGRLPTVSSGTTPLIDAGRFIQK